MAVTALSALVGQKRAADLILTGRTITGAQAARIGLATGAVPANDLDNACTEAIEHLSKLSPAALAITKKAIYAWDSMHFDKGLARSEKIYLEELMKTEDARGRHTSIPGEAKSGMEGQVGSPRAKRAANTPPAIAARRTRCGRHPREVASLNVRHRVLGIGRRRRVSVFLLPLVLAHCKRRLFLAAHLVDISPTPSGSS